MTSRRKDMGVSVGNICVGIARNPFASSPVCRHCSGVVVLPAAAMHTDSVELPMLNG